MFCMLCLLCLTLLSQPSEAQGQNPTTHVIICVYDVNSTNQQMDANFTAMASQVNLTNRVIVGQIGGSFIVKTFTMTPPPYVTQGTFVGNTSAVEWPIAGSTQEYPFDSYGDNFTFQINSYQFSNGQVGLVSNVAQREAAFCGPKKASLANIWDLTASPVSVTFAGRTYTGVRVLLRRNQLLGELLMLPIWAAALFVGASFILDAEELNHRLTIYLSVFVFTPVYLFTILTEAPSGSIFNPPEMQLTFLTLAVAISASISIVSRRLKSTGKRAALEGVTIVVLETFFILSLLWESFSTISTLVNTFSLIPFALVGILGISWRLYAST